MTMTRRQWLAAMGFAPVAGAVVGSGADVGVRSAAARRWRAEPARTRIQRRHLPNVRLVTHDGRRVRFYDDLVRDRKVLVNFIDTKIATAAVVTRNLVELHRRLRTRVQHGGDISMLTVTLAPEHDTPEVLAAFAARHDVPAGWTFLTGTPAAVRKLRTSLGFRFDLPNEDGDPTVVMSRLRHGVEPQMRWGHCPALAAPRQLALTIIGDFGPDPARPVAPGWFCNLAAIE